MGKCRTFEAIRDGEGEIIGVSINGRDFLYTDYAADLDALTPAQKQALIPTIQQALQGLFQTRINRNSIPSGDPDRTTEFQTAYQDGNFTVIVELIITVVSWDANERIPNVQCTVPREIPKDSPIPI